MPYVVTPPLFVSTEPATKLYVTDDEALTAEQLQLVEMTGDSTLWTADAVVEGLTADATHVESYRIQ